MSDRERLTVRVSRDGLEWAASLHETADDGGGVEPDVLAEAAGSGPGEVLEQIGQELDRREAERMTAVVQAGGVPLTDEERELYGDLAAVLEVLERRGAVAPTDAIASAAALDIARARRALEQAERDGVVVSLGLWRLASETEAAR